VNPKSSPPQPENNEAINFGISYLVSETRTPLAPFEGKAQGAVVPKRSDWKRCKKSITNPLTLFRASPLRLFCFLRQLDFQFSFVRSGMMLVSMV
jgi:hypothetical protein